MPPLTPLGGGPVKDRLIPWIFFGLSLFWVSSPSAKTLPYSVNKVGDGTAWGVRVENPTLYPIKTRIGGLSDAKIMAQTPPYGTAEFLVQCDGLAREARTLELILDEASYTVEIPAIDLMDGIPALWISAARRGRAALERILESTAAELRLEHVDLKRVPRHFAAMRFAPFILVSLGDFVRLDKEQTRAVINAVRSGGTLLLSVADGAGKPDVIRGLANIDLGATGPPDAELAHHLRRAFVQRRLHVGKGPRVRVEAKSSPVLVTQRLGLGEVRVLGVRFQDLEPGDIANALLETRESGLIGLFNRIRGMPALRAMDPSPFEPSVWWLLLVLPLGLLLARRRPFFLCAWLCLWVVMGLYLPAQEDLALFEEADVLAVGAGEHMVLAGSMTLMAQRQGDLLLPAGTRPIAVERIYGQGGCLISGPNGSGWLFKGEPGARLRASFVAISASSPTETQSFDRFKANDAGPLHRAELARFSKAPPLPFTRPPQKLNAAFLRPTDHLTPKPPLVLALPSARPLVLPP